MAQEFRPGDMLIFQIESGYGLLRILDVEDEADPVWHIRVYADLFQDVEFADLAAGEPRDLKIEIGHIALTDRAFESTQVSRLSNTPLLPEELTDYEDWKLDPGHQISDRSVRLWLGLR